MESSSKVVPSRVVVEPAMRVNALFQIALGLSMRPSGPDRSMGDLRVTLGAVRDGAYRSALTLANGDYDLAFAVTKGELDVASMNPSAFLSMAYRGTGLLHQPLPLRVVAMMPSLDVMLFAIAEHTGITSLAQIAERKYPLRVSVRRSPVHGTRFVADELLAAHGFSLRDIASWGGTVHLATSPFDEERMQGVRDGTIEAVFDEGVRGWAPLALESGLRFLDLDQVERSRLSQDGWAIVPVRSALPGFEADTMAPSFSGWPIFTREDQPDDLIYRLCQELDAARERMVWDSEEPVTMADLCRGTDAAPRDVPLHAGAERYYREHGYLA